MKMQIDDGKKGLKKNSKGIKILRIIIVMVLVLGFLYYENNSVDISHYAVDNIEIPMEFDGVKILQISDLHSKSFGKDQKRLIEIIRSLKPDFIFLTGDLIDYRSNRIAPCTDLITGIKDVAPIYFVTGNHEEASSVYLTFKQMLQDNGVIILDDASAVLRKGEGEILVSGISDREVLRNSQSGKSLQFKSTLSSLAKDDEYYQILLAHRPELINYYSEANFDLVFSGHAHGGQVRLPFVGGLVAPGQGLFPEYTENVHVVGDTSMVISRGLGNSLIPQRLFNHPEIVVVTLNSSDD
jgi:predicted MPP superfamily phosphohydrolase